MDHEAGRIGMRPRRNCAWAIAMALIFAPVAAAAVTVQPDWSVTLNQNGSTALYGAMVAVDDVGYIYVAGSYPWSTIVTAKFDQLGNRIWQREFDNPGTREQGSWVATHPAGGVVVAGYTLCCDNSDSNTTGYVTVRYDAGGNVLWSDVVPATRGRAVRVEVDANGNTYVIARAWNGTDDMLTIKYGPDGTREWTRALGYDASSADRPSAMAIRPNGNVLVTGGTNGWFVTGEYDPAGNLLWASRVSASTSGADIALWPGGTAYVVGGTYTQQTSNQFYVVKYGPSGNKVWSKMYPGYAARRVAVDSAGNVVVTGYTGIYTNWLTYKLDADGASLWSQTYDRHRYNDEFPYSVAIGPSDEIYITGQGGPGPTSGELSYLKTVTVRYSPTGVEDWVTYTDASVRGLGIRRGPTGTIVVVGESPFVLFHYGQTATTDPSYPGGVSGVRLARNPNGTDVDARWDPACGTASDFVVYEGVLGSWYDHAPVACTTGGVLTTTFAPAEGGRYYLVAPAHAGVEGSCGNDSSGTQRPPPPASCMAVVDPTSCP
jgi:hypothetical protein